MRKLRIGDICKNGHLLSEENTSPRGSSVRCKLCQLYSVKKYQEKNQEEIREKARNRYRENEAVKIRNKINKRVQYERNPEKFKAIRKEWVSNNKEKVRQYHSSPQMKIHSNISRAIRMSMKTGKGGRRWESIVGYSVEQLMIHLSSQFRGGMSFDNYGEWEIDHIIPRSSFDFDQSGAISECWSLANLQPLWMSENRKKWAHVQ